MQKPTLSHCQLPCGHVVPIQLMDCVCWKAESFTVFTLEGKVLHWKWYLSEFLCGQDVVAKGFVPLCTEEIAQLPVNLIPEPLSPPPRKAPVELWGLTEWSQPLSNAWFTDGSLNPDGNKTKWKAAAYSPGDGMAIAEDGTTNQHK